MILFLHGQNSFVRQRRVLTLRSAFIQKYDPHGLNVATVDAASFDIDEFRKHTRSAGLFSTKRFILLENIWSLNKDDQQMLQEECEASDADTILCINAEAPPRKNNALYKWLIANASTKEGFPEATTGQLQTFLQQEAQRHGATIEQPAITLLLSRFGTDQWTLANEMHKLANYSEHISQDAVKQFSEEALDDNIFHLTDALGARNVSRATALFEQQIAAGQAPQYLLAMLGQHIGLLLKIKRDTEGKLKLHPFVKEKATAQAEKFSVSELFALYWQILTIDERLKSTGVDAHTVLLQLVTDVCIKK